MTLFYKNLKKIITFGAILVLVLVPLTSFGQSWWENNPLTGDGDGLLPPSVGTLDSDFEYQNPVTNFSDNTNLTGDPIADLTPGNSCIYVDGTGLGGILDLVFCLLGKVIPVLVIIAIVVFIYGVVKYIRNADNAEQRKEGSLFMLYGIIALFVMVSIWALVGILGATIGVDVILPQLPE